MFSQYVWRTFSEHYEINTKVIQDCRLWLETESNTRLSAVRFLIYIQ
jgi:hypothetical protein